VVRTRSLYERKQTLKKLRSWIKTNQEYIISELAKDFGKSREELMISEIKPIVSEIKDALRNIRFWSQDESKKTPLALFGSSSKVIKEPKGVVLIIAPWNFPFMLAVGPLVSAITAGCVAVVKPSENTPYCESLLHKMISEVFTPNEVACVKGGVKETTDLLALKWDHIFFTGSPMVGKIVMTAAAKHLTSVTLELGGQNPVIIDRNANFKDAAQKLIWGKFFNCGQSCISPNYIMIPNDKHIEFVKVLKAEYAKVFKNGVAAEKETSFARIVNEHHFERVKSLIDKSVEEGMLVVEGGNTNKDVKFIAPTILDGLRRDSSIFNEEIFGPVMPLMLYSNIEEVLNIINENEKPLALYVFTKSKKFANNIIQNTSAGTTVINDTTIQFSHPNLPFGGVNHSGIGKAHGEYGYKEFTNERAVLKQRIGITSPKMIYPPYNGFKKKIINLITWWG
jgi:aldehyde dehydrogenase (NAD+)